MAIKGVLRAKLIRGIAHNIVGADTDEGQLLLDVVGEMERLTDEVSKWKNLKIILDKYEPLMGDHYIDHDGSKCRFIGIMIGDDDYYYTMWYPETRETKYLLCVGDIETFNYSPASTVQDD